MFSEGVLVRYIVPYLGEINSMRLGLLAFAGDDPVLTLIPPHSCVLTLPPQPSLIILSSLPSSPPLTFTPPVHPHLLPPPLPSSHFSQSPFTLTFSHLPSSITLTSPHLPPPSSPVPPAQCVVVAFSFSRTWIFVSILFSMFANLVYPSMSSLVSKMWVKYSHLKSMNSIDFLAHRVC